MKSGGPSHEVAPTLSLAALLEHARAVGALRGLDPFQRRMRLLRSIGPWLGDEQREAVTAHCEQVARAGGRLAQVMRLSEGEVAQVRVVALLHDIAKAGLSCDAEGESLAVQSAIVSEALGIDAQTCRAIAQQHLAFADGAMRVGPESHAIAARVLAVAHTLVQGTAPGVGSAARSFAEAMAELRRGRGVRFDPAVVVAAHLYGASAMSLAA
jgi:hypothetical protein